MRTDLQFTHLGLTPGRPTRVSIDVTNTADVIDGVTVIVDGLNPDWIKLDDPLVRLFPEESGKVTFTIDVPKDCPAGDYLVVARVVSTISADRQSAHDFWVTVDPTIAGELDVVPRIVTGRKKAVLAATVKNTGNKNSTFAVAAHDPTREVDCQVEPRDVLVPLNGACETVIRLKGPRPWFGQQVARSIVLTATSGDVELETIATFNQKPRIPRGAVTFLTLAAIVALWATIFVLVIEAIRNRDEPAKAAATAFDIGGDPSVPIGEIAATVQGTVTSSTQGLGLPRMAVQAFRIPADGGTELLGEAATGDDGAYELSNLLPGKYLLKFSGNGFPELWFPGTTNQTQATVVELGPGATSPPINIVLAGLEGGFRGLVEPPASSGPPPNYELTATLLIDDEPVPGSAEGEFITFPGVVNPDGTYELADLPAPNDFLVSIIDLDGNFAPQEFQISVAAGETKQLNPVVPSASTGELAGLVVDGAGRPLGGVTVTVSDGDFETEAITPTAGDVGRFRIIGLVTPATYIVTYSLDGFTGETQALELGPGQIEDSLSAQLVGGLGVISGGAVDPAGNRLGAVSVTVRGGEFVASSATLTDAGSTGGIGSFFVSAIPVPGNYTVTFDLEGFESVTVPATFVTAGAPISRQVTMFPLSGRIDGTVTSTGGGGVSEVTVTLSDGSARRVTVTASSPAGLFAFGVVAPGTYTLTFESDEFETWVRLVRVAAGETVSGSVQLDPAPVTESIDVPATGVAPSTTAVAPSTTAVPTTTAPSPTTTTTVPTTTPTTEPPPL